MQEDINSILEIKPACDESQQTVSIRVSPPAAASFFCALAIVPFAVVSIILISTIIYNPPLTALNGLIFYICTALAVISILLGLVGIFHIAFKRRQFHGYLLSVGGIIFSIIFFVIYFFIFFMIGFSHAMH